MDAIQVTNDEVVKVRKYFKVKEDDIKRDVKIIIEWIRQQQHLPDIDDENFIERCLLRNKFRVEQTKQKLDGYCTLRGVHLNMFEDWKSIIPSRELTTTLPLPKLTPNLERVIVWKLRSSDPNDYDIISIVKYNLLLFEVLIRNDYAVGDRFVADFTGHTAATIARNNPLIISKFLSLYQGAYSGRFVGCDFINAPPFINLLLSILKKLLPSKLYGRIRIHKDLKSFHKVVPKECLPRDYGGDLDTVENLIAKWDKVFEHNQPIFEKNLNMLSNENLRLGTNKDNSDMFGVAGTFKKLNLD
ncbi:alpha-tocopherol transfer protein-like [Tribolium madens]|uniref:alpha-tocopherol transfer protein-like n=1 Tax=Tribolium madens TaxID=41895 RepID=UPI001CF74FFC|nr:alpha-tocopherol transfer protein-like [Tribolium madens]